MSLNKEDVLRDIEIWGYSVIISREADRADTFMTAGLSLQGLPEILIDSVDTENSYGMIANLASVMRDRALTTETLKHAKGTPLRCSGLANLEVAVGYVPTETLTSDELCMQLFRKIMGEIESEKYDLIQIVAPDAEGRFPWVSGYRWPVDGAPQRIYIPHQNNATGILPS